MPKPVERPGQYDRIAQVFGVPSVLGAILGVVWLLILPLWVSLPWLVFVVPVWAGLGIWKNLAVKRAQKQGPDQDQKPSSLGLRLCLWGLAFDAILLAIAVPALWHGAVASRDYYTRNEAVVAPLTSLKEAYPALSRAHAGHQEILTRFEAVLAQANAQSQNAWDHLHPLVNPHIKEVSGQAPDAVEAVARQGAMQLGQGVLVLEFPVNGRPGYLAAAARLKKSRFATGGSGSTIVSKVVELPASE